MQIGVLASSYRCGMHMLSTRAEPPELSFSCMLYRPQAGFNPTLKMCPLASAWHRDNDVQ